MMKPILLPTLFHNDETRNNKLIGKENKLDDFDVLEILYVNINCISPHTEEDKNYSCIHANNDEFIVPLSIKELTDMIEYV